MVGLLVLCVAALVAAGGLVAFAMTTLATTTDVERMTAPLATKADVAALPTRAAFSTVGETVVTLREAVAALTATVEALSETVDAQRETIDTLSAAVDTQRETLRAAVDAQRETVGRVDDMVVALSGTVDRVNETAVRTDDVVGAMDRRLDSLADIVSPLVPCILELHRPPEGESRTVARSETRESGPLPESCQQARARARGQ